MHLGKSRLVVGLFVMLVSSLVSLGVANFKAVVLFSVLAAVMCTKPHVLAATWPVCAVK